MQARISIIIGLLLFASQASAFTYVNPDAFKSPLKVFFERVAECKFRIPCYFEERLGAFTDLNATDRQVDFPTTYNNNLKITMEQGSTSVASITTLENLTSASALSTIGTITSGTWNASVITTAYGGTGSTTWPDANTIVYASSTNSMLGVPIGTEDQILTLINVGGTAGLVPQWASGGVDETLEYDWTGDNTFTASTTFNIETEAASSFFGVLFIEGASTSTLDFSGATGNTSSSTVMSTDANGAASWNNVFASSTTYDSSGSYIRSRGVQKIYVQLWGGGGGGGSAQNKDSGGGGVGAYNEHWFGVSQISDSNIVTIGTGGAGGTGAADNAVAGGRTCLSTSAACGGTVYVSAYGGGRGSANNGGSADGGGGGGGGTLAVGANGANDGTGGAGGSFGGGPASTIAGTTVGGGGGGAASNNGGAGYWGGGGGAGGDGNTNGGSSEFGGGGGATGSGTAGASNYGGAGGAGGSNATGGAGTQPSGGGGGVNWSSGGPYSGGAGAAGRIVV